MCLFLYYYNLIIFILNHQSISWIYCHFARILHLVIIGYHSMASFFKLNVIASNDVRKYGWNKERQVLFYNLDSSKWISYIQLETDKEKKSFTGNCLHSRYKFEKKNIGFPSQISFIPLISIAFSLSFTCTNGSFVWCCFHIFDKTLHFNAMESNMMDKIMKNLTSYKNDSIGIVWSDIRRYFQYLKLKMKITICLSFDND